jgi:hypothetical protein
MTSPDSATDLLLRLLSVSRSPSSLPTASSILSPSSSVPAPPAVWRGVIDTAVFHGLDPLLFRRLKESDAPADVPDDALERLRLGYLESAGRSMRRGRELRTPLRRLRDAGLKVIILKGAFLAEAVYGDVAVRTMADVDLLVAKADLPRALAILLELGGVCAQYEDVESCCRTMSHLRPVKIGHRDVELHWTIFHPAGPFTVDVAGLWDRARPATIAGVDVLALSPADLLLHLCLHVSGSHKLRGGLRPFCDIAEVIRRFGRELDWRQVGERAREWRAARHVGLTLSLARGMLGAAVPDDVLDQLVPGGIDPGMLQTARESVLAGTGYREWMPFFDMVRVTSFGDMARLAWRRVFLSRAEMAATYPASRQARYLHWYYARRVGHVVLSYLTHTLRRARLLTTGSNRKNRAALVKWLQSKDTRP